MFVMKSCTHVVAHVKGGMYRNEGTFDKSVKYDSIVDMLL